MPGADQGSNIQQIAQATFDVAEQAQRVILAGTTEIALDSSADSVRADAATVSTSAVVPSGTATDTTVIAAFDCAKYSQFNLFSNTTSNLTATTPSLILELSPSDTDDVWVTTALTITPSATAGTVVVGTSLTNSQYRRARVKFTHAGYSAGSFKAYLNGK